MFCSISGEVPQEPVFATSTGHVYEKRLIEKALNASSGKCPVTGKIIEKEQLLPIETNRAIAPRMPETTSITNLLQTFQSEWDAVLLETHTLKKSLHETRQQLSQALYQNDAANRVIGRLLKEREQLREQLANGVAAATATTTANGNNAPVETSNNNSSSSSNNNSNDNNMEVDNSINNSAPFSKTVVDTLINYSKEILPTLKKDRPLPDNFTTVETIGKFNEIGKYSPHSVSKVGINCVSIHSDNGNILTGGNDTHGKIFSMKDKRVVGTLRGHTKPVVCAEFISNSSDNNSAVTGSDDNTCKIFKFTNKGRDKYECTQTLNHHKSGGVNGLNVHPCGKYMVSTANDKTMGFWDLETGTILQDATYNDVACSPSFHPNGMLVSMGINNTVGLYDVRTSVKEHVLTLDGHNSAITSISFSPIGTHVVSGDVDGVVKVWDLRKKHKGKSGDIATLSENQSITSVGFDYSNKYVTATSGNGVKVWEFKKWNSTIFTQTDEDVEFKGAAFSHNSSYLALASSGRYLKIYGI